MAAPIPFGRYVLLDKLAVGGMAELFLAKVVGEAGFEKTCVIKRLLPDLAVHDDFVAMFLDEARLAARLNHPGIVQVFDLGRAQDDYFLAMEYLAGEDVAAVLREAGKQGAPVPVSIAVQVIARAAEALHFAHELRGGSGALGLVHRDVSPSNLFITYQGAVKLLDFGIARAASRLRQTQGGQIQGKAPYMSPEQISGQSVDRRTDVWALGVCLHELLTGSRLFAGGSSREIARAVLEAPIPSASSLRAEVPAALSEVVQRALRRDPAERFPTAAALQTALEQVGPKGTQPALSLGEYLTGLFGGGQAEARLRRSSVLTSTLQRPGIGATQPLATGSLRSAPPSADGPARSSSRPRARIAVGLAALGVLGASGAALLRARAPTPTESHPPLAARAGPSDAPDAGLIASTTPAPRPPAAAHAGPASPLVTASPAASSEVGALSAAAEPVRHRAAFARLSLASNLPAVAFLDDRRLGALPLTRIKVAAGDHHLRVRASNLGAEREERLHLSAGAQSHTVRFSKGRLNIDADPWADVWVDGARMGQTPLAGREVWEGKHSVRLAGPAGSKTLEVWVRPGKTTVVNEKLSP